MIQAVCFDIDGTLVDTDEVVISTLQEILLAEFGETPDRSALSFVLGIPGDAALRHFTSDPKLLEKLNREWSIAAARRASSFTLFPGVKEVLKALSEKGITLGIVTSKTAQEYVDEFSFFGLDDLFDVIVTASDTERHKPAPDPLLLAAKRLKLPPEALLYVGDTTYDLDATNAAGAAFVCAAWRSQDPNDFESASYFARTPEDLRTFIQKSVTPR